MSQVQKNILWIGLIVVMVFLFTDQNFRNQIFGRGSSKTTASTVPYTATQIFSVSPANTQVILDSVTGTESGTTVSSSPSKVTLV